MSSPRQNRLCECGNPATVPRYSGLICQRCSDADAYGHKRARAGKGRSFAADGYRVSLQHMTPRR